MNIPSIKQLKDAGYLVDVWHVRRYKFAWHNQKTGKIVTSTEAYVKNSVTITASNCKQAYHYSQLLPNGGQTIVSVVDPFTGDEFEGVAYCRNDENYNKKVGVTVAMLQVANLMLVEPGYTPRVEL